MRDTDIALKVLPAYAYWTFAAVCLCALATRCPVLTQRMVFQTSFISSRDTRQSEDSTHLRAFSAMPRSATCLRACYAMPGTDIAHGDTCCAMPGTDTAYLPTGLLRDVRNSHSLYRWMNLKALHDWVDKRDKSVIEVSPYARATRCP
eukprot:3871003-Rhodomonas_salina.1